MPTITIHRLISVPFGNLNRDGQGAPKRAFVGGTTRSMLSAASIARNARERYEREVLAEHGYSTDGNPLYQTSQVIMGSEAEDLATLDVSVRSSRLADLAANRAEQIATSRGTKVTDALRKSYAERALKTIKSLNEKDPAGTGESKNSVFLSAEEIESLACALVDSTGKAAVPTEGFLKYGRASGSLMVATRGRFFAKGGDYITHASVAVSPAITTHAITPSVDYFVIAEENPSSEAGNGATFLDRAAYTSGTFYSSVSIDTEQLRKNWTGIDSPDARKSLTRMVRSYLYALPRGKENCTAPYTAPVLLLAEVQPSRFAYGLDRAVETQSHRDGGFEVPSVKHLLAERASVLAFDPSLVEDSMLALRLPQGTIDELAQDSNLGLTDQPRGNVEDLLAFVVDRILGVSQ